MFKVVVDGADVRWILQYFVQDSLAFFFDRQEDCSTQHAHLNDQYQEYQGDPDGDFITQIGRGIP